MAAEALTSLRLMNEEGQSVLEVVFVLPLLFLFIALLYKVTMSMQMAINNTQYARSQVYVLTANSPEYPRLYFRWAPNMFAAKEQDRMILGVADPKALESAGRSGTSMEPVPQTQKIGRPGTSVQGSGERGEQKLRNEIRVRNTSGICTQLNAAGGKAPMNPESIRSLGSSRWPFGMREACRYQGIGGTAETGE